MFMDRGLLFSKSYASLAKVWDWELLSANDNLRKATVILFLEGLYTDFCAATQFFLVEIEYTVNVHARTLIET
jgi:hypothetical protein